MNPVLHARRRRLHQMRRSVAAVAVCVFLMLFATIYVQMLTGHDPALASSQTSALSAAAGDDDEAVDQAAQAGAPPRGPSGVTSRQS